jgi:hypothetical protein
MRRKIAIPALMMMWLLCSCADDSRYLLTTAGPDNLMPAATAATAGEFRYTSHVATTTRAEIIALAISGPFVPGDRGKILRAVNEWNVALNGFVRFEIVPEGRPRPAGRTWTIVATHGNPPSAAAGPPLAFTYAIPDAGGLMAVYVDRIGRRDLGGVVMHELGHVLGLGHDSGGLMAAHYHPTSQQCVDKAAAQAVAAKRRLPVDQLNWCERNVASAPR